MLKKQKSNCNSHCFSKKSSCKKYEIDVLISNLHNFLINQNAYRGQGTIKQPQGRDFMGMKMNACAIYEEWVIWRIKYVRVENRLEEEALEQKKKKRRH